MLHLVSLYKKIITCIEAHTPENPGPSGVAIAFYGRKMKESDATGKRKKGQQFLFGISLHLKNSSLNYCKVTGFILT